MKANHLLNEAEMRTAVQNRDPIYNGRFFYAVTTTGVYCRPTCAARAARPENLRFYSDQDAARQAGYRACKRCKPDDPDSDINQMVNLARFLESNADEKLTLTHLADRTGLSPTHLQKRFKMVFGVSPKAYQDEARLKKFKGSLKDGASIVDATYEAGYGSSSRVYENAVHKVGMTPVAYRSGGKGENITYVCRTTSIGNLMMAATKKGVCFAMLGDSEAWLLDEISREFPNAHLIPSPQSSTEPLNDWLRLLEEHLCKNAPRPDIPLDMHGTAFQIQVWQFLLSVSEGDVVTYSEVANGIGRPKAVRAAASACARNRIAVLIPCHRVIRGDGGMGGYRWGVDRKQALLAEEKQRQETV